MTTSDTRHHSWGTAALFLLSLWMAPIALAQTSADIAPDDRIAIRQIIQSQISAFGRDDGETAFSFASPNIQAMFGTAANFLAMVRSAYMPVYRPKQIDFGDLVDDNGSLVQFVHIVGPDGALVTAAYELVHMENGSWRINGCVLLRAPQQGV
jgi:hypothetical protein